MTDRDINKEQIWEKGWDGHEKAQLRRMAGLPFREKLKWLEEAQEVLLNKSKRKAETQEED